MKIDDNVAPTDPAKVLSDAFRVILDTIDRNPHREGLADTPTRMAKAWLEHWAVGYTQSPAEILKTFEDGASRSQFVLVDKIPVYSHCEHHLAPIFGEAVIAYIPNGKIVGLSKLNRLVDCFARRLQVQERLTTQIADALIEHLNPLGVAVFIKARHMCVESRGVKQNSETSTMAIHGVFSKDDSRAELYSTEFSAFMNKCK